jgi:hypothetical protein
MEITLPMIIISTEVMTIALQSSEILSSTSPNWQSVISVIAPVTSVGSLIALYRFFKLERRESDDAVSKAQDVFFTRLDHRDKAFLESLRIINESLLTNSGRISQLAIDVENLKQQQERTSFFLLAIARTGTQPWTEESISKTLRMIREERI